MNDRIRAGLQFLRDGRQWSIKHVNNEFGKLFIESGDHDEEMLFQDTFRAEVAEGQILILFKHPDGSVEPVSPMWRGNEKGKARSVREMRQTILNWEKTFHDEGHTYKEAAELIAPLCEAQGWIVPCERTLRQWRLRAENHHSFLSPRWNQSGNRLQGPDVELLAAMKEVLAATYLQSNRFNIAKVWELVEAKYDELRRNANKSPNHQGDKKNKHGKGKLLAYIRTLPWEDVLKLQLPKCTVRALTRMAMKRSVADHVWEIVEMDATSLEILIRDENGVEIGKPVLFLAVDVASGYVVGFCLTIERESVRSFLEALRFMYFPKDTDFDATHDVKKRLEIFGKPYLLRVDNGSAFIGEAAAAIVHELHGDSAQCEPFAPWQKAHVERYNRSVKAYVRTLPGSTKTPDDQHRDLLPNEPLLTLSDLRSRILRHIFDSMALQPNDLRTLRMKKAVSPYEIVKASMGDESSIPMSRDEFARATFFRRETVQVWHYGFNFKGWNYKSEELRSLQRNGGKYEILYSEHHAETVFVINPLDQTIVQAWALELESLNLDFKLADRLKKDLAAQKKVLNRTNMQQRLAELKEYQIDAEKSGRGRNKAARLNAAFDEMDRKIIPTMPTTKSTNEISDMKKTTPSSPPAIKSVGRMRGQK